MKRIAVLLGFILSLSTFAWHVICGNNVVYCAVVSLGVMFVSTSILLFAMKWVGRILIDHLAEQRKLLEEAEAEAEAQKAEKTPQE